MSETEESKTKKKAVRAKYSRPCDGCALRKVRCDQKKPCSRCVEHNVPCTDNRLRKKCGPKHIHKKTRDSINNLSMGNGKINTLGNYNEILTIDKLLPCLQIYQTWYYGIWPVLSVAHLVSRIIQLNPSGDSTLNPENATSYSLCCAVCAAITKQLTFLTQGSNPIVGIQHNIDASEYAKEAIRSRNLFDYRLNPSHDSLLISFFLYIYYVNIKGGVQAAIMYMKEAISTAQLLGLHDPRTYEAKPPAEIHRLRKIYYMLLVTERFTCIEDNVPVCLEPSIPLPSLEDEEYSGLLTGFIELVKIFSIPDKKFFDNLINYSQKNPSNLNHFKNLFLSSGSPTTKWIINVQTELSKIQVTTSSSDTQRLNIILSKYWMKSLAWHISSQNGLLVKKTKNPEEECLVSQFPIQIAKDFLLETQDLPLFAFESNGPGVCVKLLEIALAVADSVNECIINKQETFTAFNILTSIFSLVSKFKSDITISQELYQKVESIINRKSVPSPIYPKSYFREVNDDGESITSDDTKTSENKPLKVDTFQLPSDLGSPSQTVQKNHDERATKKNGDQSPFTQMTMAFSLSPNQAEDYNFDLFRIPSLTNLNQLNQSPNSNVNSNLLNGTITPNGLIQPNNTLSNLNVGFQTFNQTLSPSNQQLQQLEQQLQHQFHQFHQNQFNQYQYGTPMRDSDSDKSVVSPELEVVNKKLDSIDELRTINDILDQKMEKEKDLLHEQKSEKTSPFSEHSYASSAPSDDPNYTFQVV
ncbi:putative probable sucrose utilization protein Suc1p [[Candida] jaroonii]|uniref:Probable sucrose utilization protein Suc1p n=1 Tax=[Candida] jaroonii TaxID=467808 RepID=A0ACA9Y263_9ASCO|nr:putative probable sucrose utilization protein Suc1p [[Candida] jaroonii]